MYVKQLFWIIISYFAGYLVSEGLKLPVPANVLGLLFLLLLLVLKWIKLSDVEGVADFIISHLALIFVPSAVGIMEYFGLFRENFIKIMVPWFVACIVGYAVTGWVTQAAIRVQERRGGDDK
ncbi:MAG: CidA/LrgA family protein [Firmicutes bacterium]|nr:CidA/LrgA family protein [Bacillota bacterium]